MKVNHLSFSYNHQSYMKDINIQFKDKKITTIIGPNGSGKSTLLALLMGIYKQTKGAIYINDINIAKYDSSVLRHLMGYVFQQAYLFKGSIRDNLTLFDTSISNEDMVNAAKQVNLHSMIEHLPEGYDTPVGYLGSLLSDGQKQLLAFGRTLIKKTPILLLDEATANIDSHTEKQIQASIENIRGSKTIVSIAHRLSTVKDANKIVYMEYGKIIEIGSFDELINLKGTFYNLWNNQHSGS